MDLNGISVLITGGCGQIGIALINHLQSKYPTCKIHVLDLSAPAISSPNFLKNVSYHAGNITDVKLVKDLFTLVKPQAVFHTAGLIPQIAKRLGMDAEEHYVKVNVEGTRIVLEEARTVGSVKAFVYTSSSDVIKGNSWENLVNVDEETPIPDVFDSLYGKSKALAEFLVLSSSTSSFPTTALRPHAVFSSQDNNMLPLMLSAPRNLHLGPGQNLYDFTYAPNLAVALTLAAINLLSTTPADVSNPLSAAGKPFFITNAEPMPFRDFLALVWATFDTNETGEIPSKGFSIPTTIALFLVWISEKISRLTGKKPFLTVKDLGDSLAERWFSNKRAAAVLGYVPSIKIADGLKQAANHYKTAKEGVNLQSSE